METIRLEFQPNIKAKILELLSSFSSDELKIVQEDENFDDNKRKLHIAYAKFKSGTEKFYTVDEVDAFLDETFSEYNSSFSSNFRKLLTEQVRYIYKDKPKAALKFQKRLT